MSDLTIRLIERLQLKPVEATETLQMDQDTFRMFYERTSRPLWFYLWRRTGDSHLADDLLQETYYRFLRARASYESEDHQRNYLFRVAANLVRDNYRRNQHARHTELTEQAAVQPAAGCAAERTDLERALEKLSPRQRDALWMAYGEGSSHQEIAAVLGLQVGSIKLLLFRARRKLAQILRGAE
jgi:RNA polymerase sigma-70 factor (ECF subfamily)